MFEKLKKFCDSFLELGLPGFDLAVYKDGESVLRYRGGYSDLENKIPMQGNERYNIYSCSKVFTCVAAMQLWERGLFALDDKLSDYMPEFAEMTIRKDGEIVTARKPILISHLFEMTAGFSYNCYSLHLRKGIEETGGQAPLREMMRYLAKDPLLFEPGERWEYSLCHDVLAALVEVLSGEKFEDYVQKHIFDVAGMQDSTFLLPEAELDTLAAQYMFKDGKAVNIGKQISTYKIGTAYVSGGAGAISTVDDYMKFLEALRTFKLLKPETIALMATDRLNDVQKDGYWMKASHGYGLGLRCPNGTPFYTDFGWGGAAGAFLSIDLENAISIYFGTHLLLSPVQGLRTQLARFVRAELLGDDDFSFFEKKSMELCNYKLTY